MAGPCRGSREDRLLSIMILAYNINTTVPLTQLSLSHLYLEGEDLIHTSYFSTETTQCLLQHFLRLHLHSPFDYFPIHFKC